MRSDNCSVSEFPRAKYVEDFVRFFGNPASCVLLDNSNYSLATLNGGEVRQIVLAILANEPRQVAYRTQYHHVYKCKIGFHRFRSPYILALCRCPLHCVGLHKVFFILVIIILQTGKCYFSAERQSYVCKRQIMQ